ncbi:hypothetical protein C8J57DRAFT_1629463 [Mycena rebaudengoi]|nr:hypothetical protein C8J57DRAFT_1629463 [Mycena rebaudengoi]
MLFVIGVLPLHVRALDSVLYRRLAFLSLSSPYSSSRPYRMLTSPLPRFTDPPRPEYALEPETIAARAGLQGAHLPLLVLILVLPSVIHLLLPLRRRGVVHGRVLVLPQPGHGATDRVAPSMLPWRGDSVSGYMRRLGDTACGGGHAGVSPGRGPPARGPDAARVEGAHIGKAELSLVDVRLLSGGLCMSGCGCCWPLRICAHGERMSRERSAGRYLCKEWDPLPLREHPACEKGDGLCGLQWRGICTVVFATPVDENECWWRIIARAPLMFSYIMSWVWTSPCPFLAPSPTRAQADVVSLSCIATLSSRCGG